jgi:hypothetical protein
MTLSSDPSDSALSLLFAQHATEQSALDRAAAAAPKVTLSRAPNPSPKIKAKKIVQAEHKPGIPGLALPMRGTLDASAYMAAVKVAGRRMGEVDPISGVSLPYTDQGEVRNDLIKAIAAYIGFDPKGNFGAQDAAARAQAMRDLQIVKVTAGDRKAKASAARSLAGYVAGMPDRSAVALANLQAQHAVTVEAIAHFVQADDKVREAVERERLSHIERQMADLGVTL